MSGQKLIYLLVLVICGAPLAVAETEAHFYNAPENINPDPNYTPGPYPLPDLYASQTAYATKKMELAQTYSAQDPNNFFVFTGEIVASATKNESTSVPGYFRDFTGVLKIGPAGPEKMEMLIDANSYDTGVPARNNRVLAILFESMKPELGTITAVFDQFDFSGKSYQEIQDGDTHSMKAMGKVIFNGLTQNVAASLTVRYQDRTWTVQTESPMTFLLTDFQFGNRIYDLMKECNHQSLANAVEVKVNLSLR